LKLIASTDNGLIITPSDNSNTTSVEIGLTNAAGSAYTFSVTKAGGVFSGFNTLDNGSGAMTVAGLLTLSTTSGNVLYLGSTSQSSTATPLNIFMGGTYSSTAGANPKLRLYSLGSGVEYGLGVSANEFDFMVPSGATYSFFVNGVAIAGLSSAGALSVSSTITGVPTGTAGTRTCYWTNSSGGGTLSASTSSRRYKKDIESILDASWIYDLRPVEFNWIDTESAKERGRSLGLIAEEVYPLCNKIVWCNDKGQPDGVNYEWLAVPMLVEMRKLRQRIEELESKLFRMENP